MLGSFDTFSAILHTFHRTAGGFYCFLRFSFDRLGSGIFGPYFRSGILRDLRCFAASVFRFREGTGNFSFFFDFPSGGLRQFFPAPIGNVGTLFCGGFDTGQHLVPGAVGGGVGGFSLLASPSIPIRLSPWISAMHPSLRFLGLWRHYPKALVFHLPVWS